MFVNFDEENNTVVSEETNEEVAPEATEEVTEEAPATEETKEEIA